MFKVSLLGCLTNILLIVFLQSGPITHSAGVAGMANPALAKPTASGGAAMRVIGMPRALLALLALTLLLAGCGGRPYSNSSGVNGVQIEMWTSSNCAQAGDTIKLRAIVTNRSGKTFTVDAKDRPVLDIITGAGGKQIRWSDGKPLTPELTHLQLKAGESKSIEMDLHLPKNEPAGTTAAQAHFISDPAIPDDPNNPAVIINVGACYGIGP